MDRRDNRRAETILEVKGLVDGEKVHARAVALNSQHESAPGPEYPIYVTKEAPQPLTACMSHLSNGVATHHLKGEKFSESVSTGFTRAKSARRISICFRIDWIDSTKTSDRKLWQRCQSPIPLQRNTENSSSIA